MANTRVCPICQTVGPDDFCRRCAFTSALASSFPSLPESDAAEGPAKAPPGYELLHELGRGSGAVVWLARESKLDRLVALKLIPETADRRLVQRLIREGRAIAMLRHPHIVAVHTLEATEHQSYLVMDFLEGGDLRQLLANRPLPPRVSAELVRKLADALAHAHAAGVLHRDIKPSNVLLNERNEPHLADFGLATTTEGGGDLTLPGQVAGTAAYLAPELLAGADRASAQSDIYGLGAVFYECLTGRPPFVGDSTAAILAQISLAEPPSPRLLNPAVPRDLETICLKCLDKIPERRYVSAAALRDDLQRYQNGEPIEARPIGRLGKAVRWCRRHPSTAAYAGLAAALLLVLAVGGPLVALRLARARTRAANEAAMSKAVAEFLQRDLLAQASPDNQPDREIKLRTVLERAGKKLDGHFSDQPLVEAAIRDTIAGTFATLGDYPQARAHWERAYLLEKEHLGPEDPKTLKTMTALTDVLRLQGKYREAEELGRQTLAAQRRVLGPEHPDTTQLMSTLAVVLGYEGKLAEEESLLVETLAIRKKRPGDPDEETLSAMNNLVQVYRAEGRLTEAESLDRETLALRTRILGPDHPKTLLSAHSLGILYELEGRYAEAEEISRQTVERSKHILGNDHPDTFTGEGLLAQIYTDEGKYDLAESVARQVLQDKTRVLGPEHPYTLAGMNNLASVLQRAGKLSEAEALGQHVLELRNRIYGPAVLDTLQTRSFLAETYQKQGRLAEATALTKEILAAGKTTLTPENPVRLKTLDLQGRLFLAQQNYADAERALRDAWTGRKKTAPEHWRTAMTASALGEALLRLQRFSEAEPLLLESYNQLKKQSSALPADSQVELTNAGARIVNLYTDWSKPTEAQRWQQQFLVTQH